MIVAIGPAKLEPCRVDRRPVPGFGAATSKSSMKISGRQTVVKGTKLGALKGKPVLGGVLELSEKIGRFWCFDLLDHGIFHNRHLLAVDLAQFKCSIHPHPLIVG